MLTLRSVWKSLRDCFVLLRLQNGDQTMVNTNDCKSPKCHERLTLCLQKKVSKKTLWAGLCVIGIPLLVTGIKVWSGQETDPLRYVEKKEMARHGKEVAGIKATVNHLIKDIREIKVGQREAQKDIKEILRYMRNKK